MAKRGIPALVYAAGVSTDVPMDISSDDVVDEPADVADDDAADIRPARVTARRRMIPLSPAMFVAAAGTWLDGPHATNNSAQLAGRFLSAVDDPHSARWDAAFVHHAGFWSHFDHCTGQSCWPLPATAACEELAEFAAAENVLSVEAPDPGEVFLLWSPAQKRFVHTGIVLGAERVRAPSDEPPSYECHTIEGNITSTGRVDGNRLVRVQRVLSPALGDRTIRWAEIEERAVSTRRRAA